VPLHEKIKIQTNTHGKIEITSLEIRHYSKLKGLRSRTLMDEFKIEEFGKRPLPA
jgi:hypothetical protein